MPCDFIGGCATSLPVSGSGFHECRHIRPDLVLIPRCGPFHCVSVLPAIPSIFGICHASLGLKLSFGNAASESNGRMLMLCHVGDTLMITALSCL